MAQKLYGLLVGINRHHPLSQRVKDLQGCENDVNAMGRLLKSNYASLDPQVKTLLDQEATRGQVIEAFRNHLTKNGSESTTLFFYFSGHGSIQAVPSAFQKYGGNYLKEETLICYDSRTKENDEWTGLDLADKEIAMLVAEAAKTGAHVVVMLDCCHSGSATRSGSNAAKQEEEEGMAVRKISERDAKVALKYAYLDGYYEKMLMESGEVRVPEGKHILLAASERDQYSQENTFVGKNGGEIRRGVFTYFLEETLLENPLLTYADLFSLVHVKVRRHLEKKRKNQNPQFETYRFFNGHSYFLSGALPANGYRKRVGVKLHNDVWQVKQGMLEGLPAADSNPKIEWLLYEETSLDKPVATARTTAVFPNTCAIETIEGVLSEGKNYLAELMSLSRPPMTVGINKMFPAISSPLVMTEVNHAHEIQVNIEGNTYDIFRKGNKLCGGVYGVALVTARLELIARWHTLFKNHNAGTGFDPGDFVVHFETKGPHGIAKKLYNTDEVIELKGSQYPTADTGEWEVPYEVSVQNNSDQHVYFALLYFDTEGYGIDEHGNKEAKKASEGKENQFMTLLEDELVPDEPGQPSVNYFRLVISTEELPGNQFAQPAIDSLLWEGSIRGSCQVDKDWMIKNIKVIVRP